MKDILRILNLEGEQFLVSAIDNEKENSNKRGFEWVIDGDVVKINKVSALRLLIVFCSVSGFI